LTIRQGRRVSPTNGADNFMSNTKDQAQQGGFGFLGLLTIVFIALKLTGYITWSWWWVLSPLLVVPVALGSLFLIGVVIFAVAALLSGCD